MMNQKPDEVSAELLKLLRESAQRLADAAPSPTSFDPAALQQRKVTDMEHIDSIDMEHFDNDGRDARDGRDSREASAGQKPRRRGSFLRIGAGALAGAVATGGFFIIRDGGLSSPAAQEVKTAEPETPYLLKFAKAPDGLCLQYARNMRDTPDEAFREMIPVATVYKRGASDIISAQVNQFGGAPEGIVGETVDVNGRKGLLNARAGSSMLSWKQGRTSVQMTSRGVKKEELLAAARSAVLVFDENGPRIASMSAPGFTAEKVDPKMGMGFGSLGYGECERVRFDGMSKNIGVSTSPKSMESAMFEMIDPNATLKESATTVTRNGKEVKAKLSERSFGNEDNTFTSISWTEKGVLASVGYGQMDMAVVKEAITGLTEASFDDYAALAKTAKQPDFPRPTMPGEAPRTDAKEIGTFKIGKSEGQVMSATQGEKLCVNINVSPIMMASGGDCRGAAKTPTLTNNYGGTSVTIASGIVDAKITKATATLPDGRKIDLSSFQDDRLPKLRVFVLARGKDDPIATAITFYDAAGKVVSEQTSSESAVETTVAEVPIASIASIASIAPIAP
jgi:hypothetical protein